MGWSHVIGEYLFHVVICSLKFMHSLLLTGCIAHSVLCWASSPNTKIRYADMTIDERVEMSTCNLAKRCTTNGCSNQGTQ